jgi:hypothetical protein
LIAYFDPESEGRDERARRLENEGVNGGGNVDGGERKENGGDAA